MTRSVSTFGGPTAFHTLRHNDGVLELPSAINFEGKGWEAHYVEGKKHKYNYPLLSFMMKEVSSTWLSKQHVKYCILSPEVDTSGLPDRIVFAEGDGEQLAKALVRIGFMEEPPAGVSYADHVFPKLVLDPRGPLEYRYRSFRVVIEGAEPFEIEFAERERRGFPRIGSQDLAAEHARFDALQAVWDGTFGQALAGYFSQVATSKNIVRTGLSEQSPLQLDGRRSLDAGPHVQSSQPEVQALEDVPSPTNRVVEWFKQRRDVREAVEVAEIVRRRFAQGTTSSTAQKNAAIARDVKAVGQGSNAVAASQVQQRVDDTSTSLRLQLNEGLHAKPPSEELTPVEGALLKVAAKRDERGLPVDPETGVSLTKHGHKVTPTLQAVESPEIESRMTPRKQLEPGENAEQVTSDTPKDSPTTPEVTPSEPAAAVVPDVANVEARRGKSTVEPTAPERSKTSVASREAKVSGSVEPPTVGQTIRPQPAPPRVPQPDQEPREQYAVIRPRPVPRSYLHRVANSPKPAPDETLKPRPAPLSRARPADPLHPHWRVSVSTHPIRPKESPSTPKLETPETAAVRPLGTKPATEPKVGANQRSDAAVSAVDTQEVAPSATDCVRNMRPRAARPQTLT